MHCPLCDTENDDNAPACVVCDSSLTHKLFEEEPKRDYKWLYISLFTLLTILFVLPWVMRKDTFETPLQVEKSRAIYSKAYENYKTNQQEWSEAKKRILTQVLELESRTLLQRESSYHEDIPFEILLSYLHEDLSWDNPSASITPIYHPEHKASFLLSKKETSQWPFQPYLSVIINLDQDKEGLFQASFSSLMRGNESLPVDSTYALFGKELEKLSRLEMYLEGLMGFNAQTKKNAPGSSEVPVTFSWEQGAFLARPNSPSLPVR